MKAVIGLGNPGTKYRATRHNVGFLTLTELARRHGDGAQAKSKFDAELAEVVIPLGETADDESRSEKLLLVMPQTFMNLSGKTVGPLVKFYDLDLSDILVICDDMNLPSGKLRMRASGSGGGQNGLSHILQVLGTNDVPRLRIGIGRPPGRMAASAYVLGKFTEQEAETIEFALQDAADAVETWCRFPIDKAMSRVNAAKSDDDK